MAASANRDSEFVGGLLHAIEAGISSGANVLSPGNSTASLQQVSNVVSRYLPVYFHPRSSNHVYHWFPDCHTRSAAPVNQQELIVRAVPEAMQLIRPATFCQTCAARFRRHPAHPRSLRLGPADDSHKYQRVDPERKNRLRGEYIFSVHPPTLKELAAREHIALSTLGNYMRDPISSPSSPSSPEHHGRPRLMTEEIEKFLESCVEEAPWISNADLAAAVKEKFNVAVSCSTISRALKKLDISACVTKVQRSIAWSDELVEERSKFCQRFLEHMNSPTNTFFIDEVGFIFHRPRRTGRRKRGHRVVVKVGFVL